MAEDKGKDGDAERTRRADALIARMKAARGYIYPEWEFAARQDPEFVETYNRIYELGLGEGRHVSAKVREFVAIALLAFRGAERAGLVAHMERAMRLGATREEIFEVLETCLVPGGAPPSIAVSVPSSSSRMAAAPSRPVTPRRLGMDRATGVVTAETLRDRPDLRRVREVCGLAGESRARGGLVAGPRAAGSERAAPRMVRAEPAQRSAGRGHTVAGATAGRAGEDPRDLGGMVVGLPARRAHPRAPRGGGRARAADLQTRRPDPGPRSTRQSSRVAQRGHRERVPERRDGQTYQSVPVAAFFTRDFRYLYHYLEFPAIYHKERLAAAMQVARPGERTREETWERFIRDWGALQQGPFFAIWTSATVDEILSALYERIVVGSLGQHSPLHT